ncbi:P-loop containing nucleoside triphosphate hydrolase protein, partial [Ochromonadaceae sp. CCMP2298]
MSSQEHAEEGEDESVKVFVRIRPLNKRELAEKQTIGWDFNETSMLEDTQNGQRVYAYDHCFGPNSTNQETYDIVGKPVVLKAMEGFNGTVFTYGQTGSGKTWTMRGCMSDPGMMILCIRDIMGWLTSHPQIKYELRISYLEVYNEEINDLLGEPGNLASKNLKIVSEDSVRGAVIGNLVEEVAQTPEDFMAILQRGESSRSYASTEMNNESSRSHTIYRVTILSHEIQEDGTIAGGGKVAYLNLVDLAGSERQKSTKAEGKTLKEGSNINKSLLALGAGGKPVFIPYRDSKLTRILKQSLGGNTLTSMLCAATPAPMHREETVSTLKFGQLCKSIKNKVKSNDGAVDDKV